MISNPRLIVISLCLLTIPDDGMRLSAFDSTSRFSSQKIIGKVRSAFKYLCRINFTIRDSKALPSLE